MNPHGLRCGRQAAGSKERRQRRTVVVEGTAEPDEGKDQRAVG